MTESCQTATGDLVIQEKGNPRAFIESDTIVEIRQ